MAKKEAVDPKSATMKNHDISKIAQEVRSLPPLVQRRMQLKQLQVPPRDVARGALLASRGPTRLLGNDVGPHSIWTKLNTSYSLSLLLLVSCSLVLAVVLPRRKLKDS